MIERQCPIRIIQFASAICIPTSGDSHSDFRRTLHQVYGKFIKTGCNPPLSRSFRVLRSFDTQPMIEFGELPADSMCNMSDECMPATLAELELGNSSFAHHQGEVNLPGVVLMIASSASTARDRIHLSSRLTLSSSTKYNLFHFKSSCICDLTSGVDSRVPRRIRSSRSHPSKFQLSMVSTASS
jgi:hypothetical protein